MKKLFTALMLSISVSALSYASTPVQWNSTTHKDYYLDVDGDGIKDLLIQAQNANHQSELIKGQQHNFSTQYLTENTLQLNAKLGIEDFWNVSNSDVVTGFFNEGPFEDALIIYPASQTAYLLFGGYHGLLDYRVFDGNALDWLQVSEERQYYTADFNGDKQTDILMTDTGQHRLYHSKPKGSFKLAQKITQKSKWGLKKNEQLYIADFNGDGRDDIFDYQNTTQCFNTDSGAELINFGGIETSGQYSAILPSDYKAKDLTLSVTCENSVSSNSSTVSADFKVNKLAAPLSLEVQEQ